MASEKISSAGFAVIAVKGHCLPHSGAEYQVVCSLNRIHFARRVFTGNIIPFLCAKCQVFSGSFVRSPLQSQAYWHPYEYVVSIDQPLSCWQVPSAKPANL